MTTRDQRDEKIELLSQALAYAEKRVAKLEASNAALARERGELAAKLVFATDSGRARKGKART